MSTSKGEDLSLASPSILSAIQKLRYLFTPEEKRKWLGIVAFALCSSFFEVITASIVVVFAQVLNQPEMGQKYLTYIGFEPNLTPGRIVFYMALALGGVYVIKNIIAGIEVFYQNFTIQRMSFHFKHKMLKRYAEVDYTSILVRNPMQSYYTVAIDSDQIFSSGMVSIAGIISEATIFIFLISLIIFMNPSLALTIFAFLAIMGFTISKILLPRFYVWGKKLQEAAAQSGQHLLTFFSAFKEIVLLGKRDAFIEAYQKQARIKARVQATQMATNALPRIVLEVVFVGLFVATITFLCLEHEAPVKMMGILGGYLYAGFRLMPGLNRIINQLNNFKAVIPGIERVHAEYQYISSVNAYVNAPTLVFNDSLKLDNVSFIYPNTACAALQHISLVVQKGECIGIVGETGSGKSTLVDVILGLLKPSEGAVVVDHKYPVNSYEWHQKIGYVPQSIYLTDDTVEANIAFGESEIDAAKLNAAIDAAQLRKFIDQLPAGIQTLTGERGVRLSGGERQRIAIARALYHSPEVLIFDEATSALDNETEERLMETIQQVSKDRTVIMIAHRLTTLKACDRIVVIEAGRIVNITNYDDLKKVG